MKFIPARRKGQRGAALLVLAAIIILGVSWMIVTALGSVSQRTSANREHNARVLSDAKAALAAWVAINALDGTENNPGRLPCPQAWGDVGSVNEGRAAGSCSVPAAGWLPWRTLGLQKPLDASGNQIWYVVSPGWHLPNTTATLTINSNTAGQLALDGQAAVALLIAPGPPLRIAPNANQLAAGCAARSQSQTLALPGTAPNPLDFLDCHNGSTADNVFTASVVDNAANAVFNDQVLALTTADILPPLEAAIAKRIEREIVPALKSVYGDATWGTSSTNPAFAFAAPFADPTTSSYSGQTSPPSLTSLYQGLLPFNYHANPGSCGADVRCSANTITWNSVPSLSSSGGPGYLTSTQSCYMIGSTPSCEGYYYGGALNISMTDALTTRITNGLRTFPLAAHTATFQPWRWTEPSGPWVNLGTQAATVSRSLASDGTARFVAGASLPSVPTWGYYYIYGSRPTISDHSILSSTDPTTGWFVRNEWYRLLYYAIAPNHAPGGTLSCTTGGTCISVVNMTPAGAQRAILILAGRSINGAPRPSATLGDYLEQGNATGAFAQQPVSRTTPFNDRVVVLDANP